MGEQILEYCIKAASRETIPKQYNWDRMILFPGKEEFLYK